MKIKPYGVYNTNSVKLFPQQIEKKNTNIIITTDATTTPVITALNTANISASAIAGRIGRAILMKSVQLRMQFKREDTATTTVQAVRVGLFYDKQPNAALPAITEVYDSGTGVNSTWLRNLSNSERFYCLFDEVYTLDGAGGSTIKCDSIYRKLNLPTQFNQTNGGTIADITTGSLILIYAGNTAAGADDMDVEIQARVRYTDC